MSRTPACTTAATSSHRALCVALRRYAGLALVPLLVLALAGCDPRSDPITPRGVGYQTTDDGALMLWTGTTCQSVTSVRIELAKQRDGASTTYALTSTDPAGSRLSRLVLGRPLAGFRQDLPFPAGFDWRDYYSISLLVKTSRGQAADYVLPSSLAKEEGDHGRGDYFVQDQGWFSAKDFARADGGAFRSLCSSINPSQSAGTP